MKSVLQGLAAAIVIAVVAVLVRHANVPMESVVAEIRDEIKARTAGLAGSADGSPEVHAIAQALLGEKR